MTGATVKIEFTLAHAHALDMQLQKANSPVARVWLVPN